MECGGGVVKEKSNEQDIDEIKYQRRRNECRWCFLLFQTFENPRYWCFDNNQTQKTTWRCLGDRYRLSIT